MRLKTLLFNRGIFVQNVRSVGWIFIAYFLSLFFAVPLRILMAASTHHDYQRMYEFTGDTLFRFSAGFQLMLMFTVPVLLGIFLFRYMQVKLSADYIHSLPIKREALYHQNIIFGFGILAIPVVVIGLILLIISSFVDAPHILNVGTIIAWVGSTVLVNIFVFMASVFVAMFTGISVFQGVLTYILLVFPAGATVLFFMNVNYFLHGFAADYYLDHKIDRLMPFVPVSDLTHSAFGFAEVAGFLLVAVAFYVVAYFVYQRRKVEMASQAVAFRPLRPVFLYGVTFCTMLLGGMYFGQTQGTFGWRLFGYIAASLIGYIVAQMILEKTWRVLTKWKGYGIFFTCMVMIALIIRFDVTGYENRIPSVENVERVYFGQSVYGMDDKRNLYEYEMGYWNRNYYEEVENIERIIELHQEIIANKTIDDQNGESYRGRGYYRQAVIGYELANGKKLVRAYQVPVAFYERPTQPFTDLMESDEYKYNQYPVLGLEQTEKVNNIRISTYRGGPREINITNEAEIKEFHELLQLDIKEMTYDEFIDDRQAWATIEYLIINDDRKSRWINTDWKKSFERIEEWLEGRDLARQVRVSASDIAFAVVAKREHDNLHEFMKFEVGEDFEKREGTLRIEDADQLETSLRTSTWRDDGEYVIAYYYKNEERPHFETIPADRTPDFIKQQLN